MKFPFKLKREDVFLPPRRRGGVRRGAGGRRQGDLLRDTLWWQFGRGFMSGTSQGRKKCFERLCLEWATSATQDLSLDLKGPSCEIQWRLVGVLESPCWFLVFITAEIKNPRQSHVLHCSGTAVVLYDVERGKLFTNTNYWHVELIYFYLFIQTPGHFKMFYAAPFTLFFSTAIVFCTIFSNRDRNIPSAAPFWYIYTQSNLWI